MKKLKLCYVCFSFALFLNFSVLHDSAFATEPKSFVGRWSTTYGAMVLEKKGELISGYYDMGPDRCPIEGRMVGKRFHFKYKEPKVAGEGWFELSSNGEQFSGSWKENGKSAWMPWVGQRAQDYTTNFSGVFETTYGKMRLLESANGEISGIYNFGGNSTIKGNRVGKKLNFKYFEKKISGEGYFELAEDGMSFNGQWRAKGKEAWEPWTGWRRLPIPGRVWLLVFEARWERSLEDKEFAFGDMLKAFFDRTANVEVRRRFFTDSTSLKRWLEEVAYFPEPTVVTIAAHGESDGLKVDGNTISALEVAEGLKNASNLKALHFSSCLVMKDKFGAEVFKALGKNGVRTAVSGYSNSVDWAASALFEMTYFDLLLSRGLIPSAASKAALKLFPIAGKNPIKDVAIYPAGFEILQ